jgi:prefoldin subunit 5
MMRENIWTDQKIVDLSEPAGRLVQENGIYVNQLIVTDMRNDYELAITYRGNKIARLREKVGRVTDALANAEAEIERLRAELAQTKVEAKEPLYDDEKLNDAFLDVGFAEYAADAFSTALVDAKRMRDAYEAEIKRLQAELAQAKEALWMHGSEHPMVSELNEAEAKQYTLNDVVVALVGE